MKHQHTLRADTLMGAALAPLDSVRSAGLVIVFSLFIAACGAVFDSHWADTDHGADVLRCC